MGWAHPKTEILSRRLDGMLGEPAAARLDRHVAGCARCQGRLAALSRIREVLRSMPPAAGPPTPAPLFIPVARPAFSPKVLALGMAAGALLAVGLTLGPVHAPMRVISNGQALHGAEAVQGRLEPGRPLRVIQPAPVDLEIPNQILLRLQPGTTITWQRVNPALRFLGRPDILIHLMHGSILARTEDGFWGSRFEVRTPTANATVTGTAFSMEVEPVENATTLKVLAGQVFLSPYLGRVGVKIGAGRVGRIQNGKLPPQTRPLAPWEQRVLLEAYRIGEDPVAALVLGAGPERVEEFFQTPLLYLTERHHPQLHPFIRKSVGVLNESLIESASGETAEPASDPERLIRHLRLLELALQDVVTDEAVAVPLRMYVAAYEARMGFPWRAYLHLQRVKDKHPKHPLAALANTAMAILAEERMGKPRLARELFRYHLAHHPQSAEALIARERLR